MGTLRVEGFRTTEAMSASQFRDVGAGDESAAEQILQLRAQLAQRDRELVAVATARHRAAKQSEHVVAALRAKLCELEAAVAACSNPSSAASSPRSDRCRLTSSFVVTAAETGATE